MYKATNNLLDNFLKYEIQTNVKHFLYFYE